MLCVAIVCAAVCSFIKYEAGRMTHAVDRHKAAAVVGRRGLEAQTKESARRYVIYCVGLGHMFLLAGCGRGARPYVSIMRR